MNNNGKERCSVALFFGTDYHVNIEVRGFSKQRRTLIMYNIFAAHTKLRVCGQAGEI